MAKWLAILVTVALAPAAAYAQPPATASFGDMAGKLRVGQEAIVVDAVGDEVEGTVVEVSPSLLLLKVEGCPEPRRFTPDGVRKISKAQNLWDGAIKGAVVGAAVMAIVLEADGYGVGNYPSLLLPAAGMGAGIGVGVDALFPSKVVYRAPSATRRIVLAPVLGGGRRGVRASISF